MFFWRNSVKRLREAADRGDADAQLSLAEIYHDGKKVRQDLVEAAKWLQKAAEQGLAEAQYNMGIFFQNGIGVSQDHSEAFTWYCRAAEQGFPSAYFKLGLMYNQGWGVPQDFAESAKWLTKSLEEAGLAEFDPQTASAAQFNLGCMYEQGQGVPVDLAEAARRYLAAAELGVAAAQFNLGNMYLHGRGVAQDYSEAQKWLTSAADQGVLEAKQLLESWENSKERMPGETMGDQVLQRDTLQHISFQVGYNSGESEPSGDTEPAIRVVDTRVIEPPKDPAEGWIEQWTVLIDGVQTDYRVEYIGDGRGGYFITSSVIE